MTEQLSRRAPVRPSPNNVEHSMTTTSTPGIVRCGATRWSADTDRRYSRHVPRRAPENCERSELEESFANGGDAVVKIAYDRYGSMVYTFCRRTVGHDDATALAQDVFVAAWRSQHSSDPQRGGLGGWLMAIARNKAIDHLRRQGRQPRIAAGDQGADLESQRADDIEMIATRM